MVRSPAQIEENRHIIVDSYATSTVVGDRDVGGLVGQNIESGVTDDGGVITNTYAAGSVTGDAFLGGLVGRNNNDSGDITGSYYDLTTTGLNDSAGGEGNDTSFFAMENNFSWDFDNTWTIGQAPDGETRPILQWQDP